VKFRFGAMLPVPDGRLDDNDDLSDFSLEEAGIHSFLAEVFADCDGNSGQSGKCCFSLVSLIANECLSKRV